MSKKRFIVFGIILVFVAGCLISYICIRRNEFAPLPKEVMTCNQKSPYGSLWLQYLSAKDSIGSEKQFREYLKKHNFTEKEYALKTLEQIAVDSSIKNPKQVAIECYKENNSKEK